MTRKLPSNVLEELDSILGALFFLLTSDFRLELSGKTAQFPSNHHWPDSGPDAGPVSRQTGREWDERWGQTAGTRQGPYTRHLPTPFPSGLLFFIPAQPLPGPSQLAFKQHPE